MLKRLKTPEMNVSRFDLVLFIAIGLIAAALAFSFVTEQRQAVARAERAVIEKAESLEESRCAAALDRNTLWYTLLEQQAASRVDPESYEDAVLYDAIVESNTKAEKLDEVLRPRIEEIATEACKDSLP